MKKRIIALGAMALLMCLVITGCHKTPAGHNKKPKPTPTPTAVETQLTIPEGVDNFISSDYVTSVILTDPNGRVYTGNSDSKLLAILLEMTKGAASTDYLGFEVDVNKYYEAKFNGPVGEIVYRFYFCNDQEKCYFKSGGGRYYHSNAKACEVFLKSEFSTAIYDNAEYPKLTVGKTVISPKALNWEYKNVSGEYIKSEIKPEITNQEDLGELSASFTPSFTLKPTFIKAKVVGEGIFFEGNFADLCYLKVSSGAPVEITLFATWERASDRDYAGEAEYSFRATLLPAASFSINKTEAVAGEILVLTCNNPDVDFDKISVKAEFGTKYEAKFYLDAGVYKALLPIPADATGKTFTYTVNAYGERTRFDIKLNSRETTSRKITGVSESTLNSIGVTSNPYPKLFASIKSKIYANTDLKKIYAYDNFAWAYKDGSKRANFADTITYSEDSSKTKYVSHDYSYVGTIYNKVTAVAQGRVVYVGATEYTGGLVVVDHGRGLFSWYWNLSEKSIKVTEGQEIKQGTVIGNNGGGGLTVVYNGVKTSIHVALTVYDVPVDLGLLVK